MKLYNWFRNHISLFFIILIISPIIDVFIAFLQRAYPNFSILGTIIRGLLLLFVLFDTLILKDKNNPKIINYLITVLLFMLFFITYKNFVYKEIMGIIKFFFFPIIVTSFLLQKENKEKVRNSLYFSGILYMLLLIVPLITNTSFPTYDHGKEGLTGWFFSPNEISSIVSLLLPFIIIKPLEDKKIKDKILFAAIALLYIYTILTIGTKTPFFALVIALIFFMIINLFRIFLKRNENRQNLINVLIIVVLLLFSITVFKNGISFQNVLYQNNNYTEKPITMPSAPTVSTTSTTVTTTKITIQSTTKPITAVPNKIEQNENKKNEYISSRIFNLIFSSRDIYLIEKFNTWNIKDLKNILIGSGQVIQRGNESVHKLIEIDLFDILFCYGVFGLIIYYIPIIILIVNMIKYLLKNYIRITNDFVIWAYYISICIGILISCIAGHMLGAPSVSLILAIIMSTLAREINKNRITEYKFLTKKRVIVISLLSLLAITLGVII